MARNPIGRFWAKVDKSGECWLWIGNCNPDGYGALKFNRRHTNAHRVAYELIKGAIPPGMLVCHSCDNPPCVNPDHLWLGTNADNLRDMKNKGRAFSPPVHRGEEVHTAKLTPVKVVEIRQRYAAGSARIVDLAREYGVAPSTVDKLLKGRSWKGVMA